MPHILGFPDSSVGKESACNAGDPSSIPGSGRSAGEEIGYPLQYSWASLVTWLVKNLPAMHEIWVWSLGWKDPLEKGKATHSSIVHGVTKSWTWLSNFHYICIHYWRPPILGAYIYIYNYCIFLGWFLYYCVISFVSGIRL